MSEFHLYRLKFEWPDQTSILSHPRPTNLELLKAAIHEKPSGEPRKDQHWHIGNVVELDEQGICFALGKVTSSTVERYDERKGDFREEPIEEAPYTYVLADLNLQVLAIAKKPRIAPEV